jgi:SHS2 domain-containing protein
MYRYSFLGHTADIRLDVEATTLEELFQGSLKGMAELMGERKEAFSLEKELSISSPDETALLIDFLSEALTACHIEKAIFSKVEFSSFSPTSLRAKIFGKPASRFEKDVKAVTYHEAHVEKRDNTFYVRIIFDI